MILSSIKHHAVLYPVFFNQKFIDKVASSGAEILNVLKNFVSVSYFAANYEI